MAKRPVVTLKSPSSRFPIPDARQVADYLRSHPSEGPSMAPFWAVVGVVGSVFAIGMFGQGPIVLLLPLTMVAGLMIFLARRTSWTRDVEARTNRVQELAMLHRWSESLQLAWTTLPELKTSPDLHARAVVLIAHNLDQLRQYDAAISAYDFLVARLPEESAASLHVRAQRAIAMLSNFQLSDADQAIRRLKPDREAGHGTPVAGAVYLAKIMQPAFTGHYDDVIALAPEALVELSPLGVEAAYGYAMLALGYLQLSRRDAIKDQPQTVAELDKFARLWWRRATTLMPPAALLARYEDLAPLLEVQARPSPIWVSPTVAVAPSPEVREAPAPPPVVPSSESAHSGESSTSPPSTEAHP